MLVISENSARSNARGGRTHKARATPKGLRSAGSASKLQISVAASLLIAAIDEPTELDRRVYDWARRSYSRRRELAQLPIELFGLPGVYIPFALLVGRMLKRRRRGGASTIATAAIAGWIAVRVTRLAFYRPPPPPPPRPAPK